jgi:hypothetical protein
LNKQWTSRRHFSSCLLPENSFACQVNIFLQLPGFPFSKANLGHVLEDGSLNTKDYNKQSSIFQFMYSERIVTIMCKSKRFVFKFVLHITLKAAHLKELE